MPPSLPPKYCACAGRSAMATRSTAMASSGIVSAESRDIFIVVRSSISKRFSVSSLYICSASIDPVALDRHGEYWAIQAKFRSERDQPLIISNPGARYRWSDIGLGVAPRPPRCTARGPRTSTPSTEKECRYGNSQSTPKVATARPQFRPIPCRGPPPSEPRSRPYDPRSSRVHAVAALIRRTTGRGTQACQGQVTRWSAASPAAAPTPRAGPVGLNHC
jgi:hypothetical protein